MAIVSRGFATSITLVDSGGNATSLEIKLTSADAATAATDAAVVRVALLAITDSVISRYSVSEVFEEDALTLPADAENETKLSLTCRIYGAGDKKGNLRVPAPKIAAFSGTSGSAKNVVNYSSAIVGGWLNIFRNSTGVASFNDGEFVAGAPGATPIAGLVKGVRTTVRSRQG